MVNSWITDKKVAELTRLKILKGMGLGKQVTCVCTLVFTLLCLL